MFEARSTVGYKPMSTKDCNADKSRERTDAETENDCGCCEELACFDHYEADDARTVDGLKSIESGDVNAPSDYESTERDEIDVDTSGGLSRIDSIDDVEA